MLVTLSTGSLALHKDKLRMRVFAEMSILVTSNLFLTFNIVSVEDNFTLGYVAVGVVALYVFISLLVILKDLFVYLHHKLRLCHAKWNFRVKRKQLKTSLKSTKQLRRKLLLELRS